MRGAAGSPRSRRARPTFWPVTSWARWFRAGWLPGAGRRAVTMDGLAVGAGDLAGAVGVDGQGPAEFVQDDVVMPPAVIFEVGEAGVAAVGAVGDVVGFAGRGGLVAAAGELAYLVPQGDQAPQVDGDVVGLVQCQRQIPRVGRMRPDLSFG